MTLLGRAQNLRDCHYFTHNNAQANGLCLLFNNCPEIDGSCTSCVSGKKPPNLWSQN